MSKDFFPVRAEGGLDGHASVTTGLKPSSGDENIHGEFYGRSKPCVVVAEHRFYKGKTEQQHTVYTRFTTV